MSDWTHLKTEFYWIYEGVVRPEYLTLAKLGSPGRSAYFLKEGELKVETASGKIFAKAGDWVLPSSRMIERTFTEGSRFISIRFCGDWPDGQPCFDSDIALVFPSADFPELKDRADALLDLVETLLPDAGRFYRLSRGDLLSHLRIRESFISWLVSLVEVGQKLDAFVQKTQDGDERIFEAARLLDRHPLDMPFREEELAQEISLSSTQLDRLFKKEYQLSPRQYLDARRLKDAEAQLQVSTIPVKQIAYELGFKSLSYFSRWFSKNHGESPRAFRQRFEK